MKLNSIKKHYQHHLLDLEEAINELYSFCEKHYKIYKIDLRTTVSASPTVGGFAGYFKNGIK